MDKIGTKCFYEVSFLNLKKGSKLTELFQTICSPFFIKETVGFYLAFDVHYSIITGIARASVPSKQTRKVGIMANGWKAANGWRKISTKYVRCAIFFFW